MPVGTRKIESQILPANSLLLKSREQKYDDCRSSVEKEQLSANTWVIKQANTVKRLRTVPEMATRISKRPKIIHTYSKKTIMASELPLVELVQSPKIPPMSGSRGATDEQPEPSSNEPDTVLEGETSPRNETECLVMDESPSKGVLDHSASLRRKKNTQFQACPGMSGDNADSAPKRTRRSKKGPNTGRATVEKVNISSPRMKTSKTERKAPVKQLALVRVITKNGSSSEDEVSWFSSALSCAKTPADDMANVTP